MKFSKWCENKWTNILSHPVKPYLFLFFILLPLIILVSLFKKSIGITGFGENILVESFGMLFDLIIIGAFIGFIHHRGELRSEIKRYMDEIDDFRGWESEEAKFRIVGNIRRLNRLSITNIDLNVCFLRGANLSEVNLTKAQLFYTDLCQATLVRAILSRANFQWSKLNRAKLEEADLQNVNFSGSFLIETDLKRAFLSYANLSKADLKGANFQGAELTGTNLYNSDLRGVKNLTINQLSLVKTLYKTKLDPDLEKQIKEKYPFLLKKPKEEEGSD